MMLNVDGSTVSANDLREKRNNSIVVNGGRENEVHVSIQSHGR
jgi:hypothetical protein